MKLVASVFIVVLLFTSCGNSTEYISDTRFMLDTFVNIKLYDPPDESILKQAFELCLNYEKLLSKTIYSSDISKINSAGGEFSAVLPQTASIIEKGINYGKLSDGLFDITIAPLSNLWNFTAEKPFVPNEADILSAIDKIDYRNIEVQNDKIKIPEGSGIDLGAIAKGFIADKIADYLKNEGVSSAIINLGGNVVTVGSKLGDDKLWSVGIKKPFGDDDEIIGTVQVSEKSVVSSGIYERSFISDGKLYHHILNPKTGYPVENDVCSVTVISDCSADGDAYSTICLLLGAKDGIALIEKTENTEAVFILNNGDIIKTSGIGKTIPFN